MKHLVSLALAGVVLAAGPLAGPTRAADPRHPDWPCQQIKVPELSLAAVWAGPPVDDVGNAWQNDAEVRDMVGRLAARRTPIDDAEKAIGEFVTGTAATRESRAKLLMAGLFATLNAERGQVMTGIERFARKQKDFAEKIRAETRDIRALQDAPTPDQAKIEELANVINWDTRIFEEQRRTIGFVCDVPTAIERRLGALARAIQQALE